MTDGTVEERLQRQKARIEQAAVAAGRDPRSVRLLAVSKTQSAEKIRRAYLAGQRDFGENYVQELVQKAEQLADLKDLRWHMIGHLQTNKARSVAPLVTTIHSVDSQRLVHELEKRMVTHGGGAELGVLIEVNVGAETQKSGGSPEQLPELMSAVEESQHLRLLGLMTLPPLTQTPDEARPFFERLRSLREEHGGAKRLPELSMGMSGDCETAIECGATWVRLGTAIFGPRHG